MSVLQHCKVSIFQKKLVKRVLCCIKQSRGCVGRAAAPWWSQAHCSLMPSFLWAIALAAILPCPLAPALLL